MVNNSGLWLYRQISANLCLLPYLFISPPLPHFSTKIGALFFSDPQIAHILCVWIGIIFFYFATMATFFDQNWCSFFLWPTNCSYFMCMKWHQFWSILGFARSESLGGVKSPPPSRNQLFQRPVLIGLIKVTTGHWETKFVILVA